MSDERELKLQCLSLANGDVHHAEEMYAWLNGRNQPSPDNEFEVGFNCGLEGSQLSPGSASGIRGRAAGDLALKWKLEAMRFNDRLHTEAIAALQPEAPALASSTDEGGEIEIPEGFTRHDGGELMCDAANLPEVILRNGFVGCCEYWMNWTHKGDLSDIIAYRIIEPPRNDAADEHDDSSEFAESEGGEPSAGDPSVEPESGLHGEPVEEAPALNPDMQDERELTAQNDYDTTGILTADDMQGGAVPNFAAYPVAVTEGYAPVTNPEADALARAHDWYSPEKVAERQKFNPFRLFKRETEEV